MKSKREQEKIRKSLKEEMVVLGDPEFSLNIVARYIEEKEKEKFKLFWNNDLIYAISFVVLALYSLPLWFNTAFSEPFNQLNITIEHLALIIVISFVFLIFRFVSEFYLIKPSCLTKPSLTTSES